METKHIPIVIECGSTVDAIVKYELEAPERISGGHETPEYSTDEQALRLTVYSIMIKGIEFIDNPDYKNDVLEYFENDNHGKDVELC